MSSGSILALLRWELRQVLKSQLLWLTLVVVGAVFLAGASSGAALHRAQAEAQARTLEREQSWMEDVRARGEKYRRASATPLPYWQDPTDVAGFSQYFLLKHSFKPHLPLSPLAVGVSDLLPDRQQIKLGTLFGSDDAYDFNSPRGLALGRFDLAFAVGSLLPVALILLSVLLCTYERDRGVLRLVAAQPVSPRRFLSARLGALAVVLVPAVSVLFVLALAVAGVPLGAGLPELVAAAGLLVTYVIFWLALAGLVLSHWPRAVGALSVLGASWLAFLVIVPLVANVASSLQPPVISAARLVDMKRTVNDRLQDQRDEIVSAAVRARPDLAALTGRVAEVDYATRLTFLIPELERRLHFTREAQEYERARSARLATWVGYIAPNLALTSAFATLAGTDQARHQDFEAQSRAYQLELRAFFYPRIQRELVAPSLRHAYGRFSFTDYDSVPGFQMKEQPAAHRVNAALPIIAWLFVLAATLFAVSMTRLRSWPEAL